MRPRPTMKDNVDFTDEQARDIMNNQDDVDDFIYSKKKDEHNKSYKARCLKY